MKKKLFFAALAVVALASCTNEEVLEVNKGETICFRTIVSGNTRATPTTGDVATDNIEDFNVCARLGDNSFFDNVDFTKQSDGTFTSANKYYWPASGTLDFYAYAPKSGTGISRSAFNTWTVTQQKTPSDQPDFVVAKNSGDKANNAVGVVLNFRHAMSKISVKLKNTNTGMKMEVKNWKIAYIYNKGTFSLGENNTTGNITTSGTTLLTSDWTYTGASQAVTNVVSNGDDLSSTVTIAANTTAAASVSGFGNFIVIPQTMKSGTAAYASTDADAAWATPYIAVKMTIKNNDDAGTVLASEQWCCWPITTTWEPGKHYTYVIDLAGGGYQEKNDGQDEDPTQTDTQSTTDLDPVLKDAEIKFVSVTVDEWSAADDINIAGPTE